jgi:hypothetical protein
MEFRSHSSLVSVTGSMQVISLPKYVWWVKIRNKEGLEGWTRETRKFGNMDACG